MNELNIVKLEEAIHRKDVELFETVWKQSTDLDVNKKSATDSVMRNVLLSRLAEKRSDDILLSSVQFSFDFATKDFCSRGLPVNLLSDIFDSTPINECEKLFEFVEDNVPRWKSDIFFEPCRNHLLRMCNDLLRRLSRTTDTGFCGKILVFLARCLPLTEKSGLNMVSQFNVDNVTKFDPVESTGDQADGAPAPKASRLSETAQMDVEEGEMDDSGTALVMVDYNLYCKFWQLQQYFSSPLTCYDKFGWKKFIHNAAEVLNAFDSHKPEPVVTGSSSPVKSKLKKLSENDHPHHEEMDFDALSPEKLNFINNNDELSSVNGVVVDKENSTYFAKYLTSQKLLQLQLNDNNFRRYVLVQFLILFQYLTTEVKQRDKKLYNLNDEQLKWVNEMNEKCYDLLRETYPDGEKFAKSVKHLLAREEHWNRWKNAGCEDFTKRADKEKMAVFKRRTKPKFIDNPLDLGNPVLTKLWSTCSDNFEACKAADRQFIPDLETFLEEPVEQDDPASGIEAQYRLINDENFQWRALRLMALKSDHFFLQPQHNQILPISDFLNSVMIKTAKDFPKFADAKTSISNENNKSDNSSNHDKFQDQELKTENDKEEEAEFQAQQQSEGLSENLITEDQISLLSIVIGAEWPKLASFLNLPQDDIEGLKKNDPEEACKQLLTLWSDQEGNQSTVRRLRNILLQAELFDEDVGSILHRIEDNDVGSVRSEIGESNEERVPTPLQDENMQTS